jgi:hypothetical protein
MYAMALLESPEIYRVPGILPSKKKPENPS